MNLKTQSANLLTRDIILEFERQHDPFRYQVDGVSVWPLFRFAAFEHMKIGLGNFSSREISGAGNGQLRIIKNICKAFFEARKIVSFFLKKRSIEVFSFSNCSRLRDQRDGLFLNIYFDYFDPPIKKSLYWYTAGNKEERLKNITSNYLNGRVWLLGFLLGGYRYKRYDNVLDELYGLFVSFLTAQGKEDCFQIPFSEWRKVFLHYYAQKCLCETLFRLIRPNIMLVECAYTFFGAVAAAKKKGLPVWELQHGVLYDGHMAYTYDTSSRRYRENLPLPDKILTYGPYSSEILKQSGFWQPDEVPAIGLPRLAYFQGIYASLTYMQESQLRVLISSQWIMVNKMIPFLDEVSQVLPAGVTLLIKPHPLESVEQTRCYQECSKQIEVLEPSCNFYEALSQCHIHCSVFSTTLFESLAFGVPTLVIGLDGYEHAFNLVESGSARFAKTAADLVGIIQAVKRIPQYWEQWRDETVQKQRYFWEPNPGEKFQALLEAEFDRGFAKSKMAGTES